jgi:seryl-tRNA synthetase
MLDIRLLRETPDVIRKDLEKRGRPTTPVDEVLAFDATWRDAKGQVDRLRAERNKAAQEIANRKKSKQDASELIASMKSIGETIETLEAQATEAETARDKLLWGLPNIMHPSVPVGADDTQNQVVSTHGRAKPHEFEAKSHVDLLASLDIADLDRAARSSGARFFYLKNEGVLLSHALQRYALDYLRSQGFTLVDPPYMLRHEAVSAAVDLNDFKDVIYKIEDEDLYLIATSEHALAAMHWDEIIEEDDLPVKYAGISPCFRKEAGAHGKDTKGIFRVRQFHKIEQFVFATPETSWKIHEELRTHAEALVGGLGLPYRVVNICTGDLGTVAAKKYDIEAWMPVQNTYREVVSCSNCTDYQARRYKVRTRPSTDQPTRVLHTLNSTAIAVERTMVAILENYQDADGRVHVPKALHPYMDGVTVLEPKA